MFLIKKAMLSHDIKPLQLDKGGNPFLQQVITKYLIILMTCKGGKRSSKVCK